MDPTAAPVDLEIAGRTYQAYPLRDIDHETMNKWVRQEYVKRTKDSVSEDEDLQRLVLSQVLDMTWMSGDGMRVTCTVAGVMKLASLMCRKQKLPPEEEFATEDNLERVFDVFKTLHLNGRAVDENEAEEGNLPPKKL